MQSFLFLVLLVVVTSAGKVSLDQSASAITAAGEDYGNLVFNEPFAVNAPMSVNDVKDIVKFAKKHEFTVAAQGQTHSVMGQAQALDGIAVNMSNLNQVLEVNQNSAWVEAGCTWRELLEVTLLSGLTPPVFTDYIDLSIGGTVSCGGIGSTTYKHGLQIDNVLSLEIVTGNAQVIHCSTFENSELFHAAIGGLGQFGIITKAEIRLIEAEESTRYVRTLYTDYSVFLDDMYTLMNDERYNGVQGFVQANDYDLLNQNTGFAFPQLQLPIGSGANLFMIEASVHYTGNAPDINVLQSNLNNINDPAAINILDMTYYEFVARLDPTVAFLISAGIWDLPHPWIDVYVSREASYTYIPDELSRLGPNDVNGPILVYPVFNEPIRMPNYPLPDSDDVVLFGLLRTAFTPSQAAAMAADNFALYDRCLAVGGTGYSIDAVPLYPERWVEHFGNRYPAFAQAKDTYDPCNLFAPGQNIFPNPGSCKCNNGKGNGNVNNSYYN